MISKDYIHPLISGLCGSLAGFMGKLAFQDEMIYDFSNDFANLAVRVVLFALMLNFNKLMFKFMFNSFQVNGATLTTSLNFMFGNIGNALTGWIYLNESLQLKWFIGMIMIQIGIMIMPQSNKEKKD